ncbi:MAG: hypothetical protein H6710_05080 [Myxococcales bacterium]|nr:hypothetical protein [Myxococcales bacterium]MCB9705575.1 hypothetical protein [Myxococcales bacterium]
MSRATLPPLALALVLAPLAGCFADEGESAGGSATEASTGDTSGADASTGGGSTAAGTSTGSGGEATGTTGDATSGATGDPTAAETDSDTDTGDPGDPLIPELYPPDRRHSPITANVAASIKAIAARAQRDDQVFAKVGASATATTNFLHCFADDAKIDLFGRDYLQDTIEHFRVDLGDGTTPFDRESLCAVPGWSAGKALTGDPSPLQQEVDAIDPRFAVVMYGTNDINLGSVTNYGGAMLTLVETLIDQGVVPILTSVMPRDDDPDADHDVPAYNAVVRAVAQVHQIPFIDFHRELVPLDDHGLGGDGIHRSAAPEGACVLTPDGLTHGANIRNLITLEALDRGRMIAVKGLGSLDPATDQLAGAGSPDDPFEIPFLPFGDRRDTSVDGAALIDVYTGCAADQDESGRELYYRLEVTETTAIRAIVIDRGDVDVDIHLVDASASGAGCIDRADKELTAKLAPGTYYLIVDTFISAGKETAGEYLLVVAPEPT